MTKIMIVDDSLRARRALKALLNQQAGLDVITEASNGQEAIHNITERTPDIVLMDVCMPVMDGLEATKAIKAKWPQIKIIILTMYAEHKAEALAAGANAFLIKGCPLDEVTALVRDFHQQEAGDNYPVFMFLPLVIPPLIK